MPNNGFKYLEDDKEIAFISDEVSVISVIHLRKKHRLRRDMITHDMPRS